MPSPGRGRKNTEARMGDDSLQNGAWANAPAPGARPFRAPKLETGKGLDFMRSAGSRSALLWPRTAALRTHESKAVEVLLHTL